MATSHTRCGPQAVLTKACHLFLTHTQQPGDTSSWAVAALTSSTGGPDDNAALAIPIDMRSAARDSKIGETSGTGIGQPGDPSYTMSCAANARLTVGVIATPLAIRGRDGGAELEAGQPNAPANALRSAGGGGGGSLYPLVAITDGGEETCRTSAQTSTASVEGQPPSTNETTNQRSSDANPATSLSRSPESPTGIAENQGTIVRRLTPLECERLQGYPDGWTDNGQADSARYRQLGNSVAVPCVEWIARRLINIHNQQTKETGK